MGSTALTSLLQQKNRSLQQIPWSSQFNLLDKQPLNNTYILHHQPTSTCYKVKHLTLNKTQNSQMFKQIQIKNSNPSPFVIKIQKIQQYTIKGYCSQHQQIFIMFKHIQNSLKQQILNRRFKREKFRQEQIKVILQSGVKGIAYLHDIGCTPKALNTSQILISPQRSILINDPLLSLGSIIPSNSQRSGMQHIGSLKQKQQNIQSRIYSVPIQQYPSPQKLLYQNDLIQQYNEYLSQLFTFGMIVLQTIFLQPLKEQFYDKSHKKIYYHKVKQKIEQISSGIQLQNITHFNHSHRNVNNITNPNFNNHNPNSTNHISNLNTSLIETNNIKRNPNTDQSNLSSVLNDIKQDLRRLLSHQPRIRQSVYLKYKKNHSSYLFLNKSTQSTPHNIPNNSLQSNLNTNTHLMHHQYININQNLNNSILNNLFIKQSQSILNNHTQNHHNLHNQQNKNLNNQQNEFPKNWSNIILNTYNSQNNHNQINNLNNKSKSPHRFRVVSNSMSHKDNKPNDNSNNDKNNNKNNNNNNNNNNKFKSERQYKNAFAMPFSNQHSIDKNIQYSINNKTIESFCNINGSNEITKNKHSQHQKPLYHHLGNKRNSKQDKLNTNKFTYNPIYQSNSPLNNSPSKINYNNNIIINQNSNINPFINHNNNNKIYQNHIINPNQIHSTINTLSQNKLQPSRICQLSPSKQTLVQKYKQPYHLNPYSINKMHINQHNNFNTNQSTLFANPHLNDNLFYHKNLHFNHFSNTPSTSPIHLNKNALPYPSSSLNPNINWYKQPIKRSSSNYLIHHSINTKPQQIPQLSNDSFLQNKQSLIYDNHIPDNKKNNNQSLQSNNSSNQLHKISLSQQSSFNKLPNLYTTKPNDSIYSSSLFLNKNQPTPYSYQLQQNTQTNTSNYQQWKKNYINIYLQNKPYFSNSTTNRESYNLNKISSAKQLNNFPYKQVGSINCDQSHINDKQSFVIQSYNGTFNKLQPQRVQTPISTLNSSNIPNTSPKNSFQINHSVISNFRNDGKSFSSIDQDLKQLRKFGQQKQYYDKKPNSSYSSSQKVSLIDKIYDHQVINSQDKRSFQNSPNKDSSKRFNAQLKDAINRFSQNTNSRQSNQRMTNGGRNSSENYLQTPQRYPAKNRLNSTIRQASCQQSGANQSNSNNESYQNEKVYPNTQISKYQIQQDKRLSERKMDKSPAVQQLKIQNNSTQFQNLKNNYESDSVHRVTLYADGSKYMGQTDQQGESHGYGVLYYQDGKVAYEGQWFHGDFNGKGRLYNPYYIKMSQSYDYKDLSRMDQYIKQFEGYFIHDIKQGKGVLKMHNDEIYDGEFVNDLANGRGKYYSSNGSIIQGIWQKGMLIKQQI